MNGAAGDRRHYPAEKLVEKASPTLGLVTSIGRLFAMNMIAAFFGEVVKMVSAEGTPQRSLAALASHGLIFMTSFFALFFGLPKLWSLKDSITEIIKYVHPLPLALLISGVITVALGVNLGYAIAKLEDMALYFMSI